MARLPRPFGALLVAGVLGLMGCEDSGPVQGSSVYFELCASCHAADGRGSDKGPSLVEEAAELGRDDIIDVVLDGEGLMNPQPLSLAEAEAVADFVLDTLVP